MAQPEIGFTAAMPSAVIDSSFALFVIFGKKLESLPPHLSASHSCLILKRPPAAEPQEAFMDALQNELLSGSLTRELLSAHAD